MAPGFPGTFSPPLEAASLRAFRVPCLQFWDGATNPKTPPRASLGLGAVGRKDEIKHAGTLEITMEHEGKSTYSKNESPTNSLSQYFDDFHWVPC
jgi:hypothetical protein